MWNWGDCVPDSVETIGFYAFANCPFSQSNSKASCLLKREPICRVLMSGSDRCSRGLGYSLCWWSTNGQGNDPDHLLIPSKSGDYSIPNTVQPSSQAHSLVYPPDFSHDSWLVTSINGFAFDGCSSLETVSIPKGLEYSSNAFPEGAALNKY